jgi:6-phospho 3-hexuloisomerase
MDKEEIFEQSLAYIQRKLQDILQVVSAEDVAKVNKLFFDADRIFVYGAGRSGLVSKAFAIRLVHLGFQTFVIGETIGAPVKKGDLVVIVSGSGETIPAVMTAEIARKMGAKLIVITERRNSRITQFADIALVLSATCKEPEKKILAPLGTLFEASAWVLLDSIVAELMKHKGETEESMRKRHATL